MGQLLDYFQEIIHRYRIVVDLYLGLLQVVFPDDLEYRLFSVFLKGGIYHHPLHPALKGAFILVLAYFLEDHQKGILQVVFRLLIAGGIFKAYGKQLVRKKTIQLLLGLNILLLTFLYKLI